MLNAQLVEALDDDSWTEGTLFKSRNYLWRLNALTYRTDRNEPAAFGVWMRVTSRESIAPARPPPLIWEVNAYLLIATIVLFFVQMWCLYSARCT